MQHSGTEWGLCVCICVLAQPCAYAFKFIELREDAGGRKTLPKMCVWFAEFFSHHSTA